MPAHPHGKCWRCGARGACLAPDPMVMDDTLVCDLCAPIRYATAQAYAHLGRTLQPSRSHMGELGS